MCVCMFVFVHESAVHHDFKKKNTILAYNSGIRYSPSRQGRHVGWASLPIAAEGKAAALHTLPDKQGGSQMQTASRLNFQDS